MPIQDIPPLIQSSDCFSNAPRRDEDPWQVDKRWVPTPWGDIEPMPKPMICLVPPQHLGLGKVKFFFLINIFFGIEGFSGCGV